MYVVPELYSELCQVQRIAIICERGALDQWWLCGQHNLENISSARNDGDVGVPCEGG